MIAVQPLAFGLGDVAGRAAGSSLGGVLLDGWENIAFPVLVAVGILFAVVSWLREEHQYERDMDTFRQQLRDLDGGAL